MDINNSNEYKQYVYQYLLKNNKYKHLYFWNELPKHLASVDRIFDCNNHKCNDDKIDIDMLGITNENQYVLIKCVDRPISDSYIAVMKDLASVFFLMCYDFKFISHVYYSNIMPKEITFYKTDKMDYIHINNSTST